MATTGPVGVGFIGTGMISNTYLENLTRFPDIDVVILGDLNSRPGQGAGGAARRPAVGQRRRRARPPRRRAGGEPDHPRRARRGRRARRSPPASTCGRRSRSASTGPVAARCSTQAEAAGLLVGVAPDTVLGPGVQTARRAIARGDIGEPLSAQTVMQYIGPDIFHPSPEFLFAKGAGPLFDIGPYYLTTLVHVFGSVRERRRRRLAEPAPPAPSRPATAPAPCSPSRCPPTSSAIAQFVDGGVSQSVFSFDSPLARWASSRSPAPRAP